MQDAHAALEAGAAHLDEFRRRALEPGRGHPAVVVPDSAKALPVAGVAPQRPVLHGFDDRELVVHGSIAYCCSMPAFSRTAVQRAISARRCAASASGVEVSGTNAAFASCLRTSSRWSTVRTPPFSRATTDAGVFAGNASAYQVVTS